MSPCIHSCVRDIAKNAEKYGQNAKFNAIIREMVTGYCEFGTNMLTARHWYHILGKAVCVAGAEARLPDRRWSDLSGG